MAYTTIDDSSVYFQTKVYTGNGADGTAHTNDGNANLQPDFAWIKRRSPAQDNVLFDSSRGPTKNLRSNTDAAESTNSNFLQSFNTDGFTVGTSARVNNNGDSYVAWQWKCNGGTTASNSNGTITSTVQINTTAGFSIVLYTGNETSGATVGHGFSSAPDVVIIKRRVGSGYWIVNSNDLDTQGTTGGTPDAPRNLYFNTTDQAQSDKICQAINATTFTISNSNSSNANNDAFLAYCFKEVKGYSKFGHYIGNGQNDGPFIYTGFKPAWLLVKVSGGVGANNWFIIDNKRDTYQNPFSDLMLVDETTAENADTPRGDFLSNGFKWQVYPNAFNAGDGQYFYMAFAESPFVSSAGVPTTAK